MPYIEVKLGHRNLSVSAGVVDFAGHPKSKSRPFSAIIRFDRRGSDLTAHCPDAPMGRPVARGSKLELMLGGQWEPGEIELMLRMAAKAVRTASGQLKSARPRSK